MTHPDENRERGRRSRSQSPQPGRQFGRDPEEDCALVALHEQIAGPPSGFAEHAARRLATGDRLYGNDWVAAGLPRLLREMTEEAADLGGWGMLARRTLERSELPWTVRAAISADIRAAIHAGALAHLALARAQTRLGREESSDLEAEPS